jgi:mono/diheme cytochrome c family protein
MRWVLCAAALLLVTVGVVASGARAPERLSETGLYVDGQPGVIAPANRPFSPQYPLWTDGATKSRWVYLPPGARIDAGDPDGWDIPVGTKFWKQFEFSGRKVETRMIWRASPTQWVFATYVWNPEGTEAVLAPEGGVQGVAEVGHGKRHSIPSRADCTTCHGTTRPGPLGFNALQLSPDRDPNAIHGEPLRPGMMTLRTLLDEQRLANAPSELRDRAPRIATSNPRTRAVLGYMLANCGSCHNGRGEIAALGPVLRYDDLLRDADATAMALLEHRTKWQVPGRDEGSRLIDPDAPEQSALLVRLRSRSPSSQMPPLGTVVRDAAAVEAVTAWISRDVPLAARRSHR